MEIQSNVVDGIAGQGGSQRAVDDCYDPNQYNIYFLPLKDCMNRGSAFSGDKYPYRWPVIRILKVSVGKGHSVPLFVMMLAMRVLLFGVNITTNSRSGFRGRHEWFMCAVAIYGQLLSTVLRFGRFPYLGLHYRVELGPCLPHVHLWRLRCRD